MKKALLSIITVATLLCVLITFSSCNEFAGESNTPTLNDPSGSPTSNPTEAEPTETKQTLTDIPTYSVTFDYNDGTGRKELFSVPKGQLAANYAPQAIEGNKEIIGWSAQSGGSAFLGTVTADMTLYAIWTTIEPVVYTDDIPNTVNDKIIEIKPEVSDTALQNKVLKIGPQVRSITFISDGTPYDKFSIMIADRTTDINIVFDNFCFTSNVGYGIKGESSNYKYNTNITVKERLIIDCYKYSVSASTYGANCISVPNLSIMGTGSVLLMAGYGQNGENKGLAGNGQDGENGGNGTNGGNGIIAENVTVSGVSLEICAGNGGNGGQGGGGNNSFSSGSRNGGKGGNGGNGGTAIQCNTFVVNSASLELKAGNGGNGGNGGEPGGNFITNGSAGDGGNGGNGGNVFPPNVQYKETFTTSTLTAGQGGSAGAGGNSDNGLLDGDGGVSGTSGSTNIN